MKKFYNMLRASFFLILIALLNFVSTVVLAQTEMNTLADGIYYLKLKGTNQYATRDPNAGGVAYEANWIYSKVANADRTLQRFEFMKRESGRYTIRVLNPGANEGYMVEYWESYWMPGYDAAWHTFNVYKNTSDGSYAIQTGGNAGMIYIAFSPWDPRKRLMNHGITDDISPVSFPFELIPYESTKSEANLALTEFSVKTVGDANFTPTVSTSSNATVSYTSSNANVAVIESGQVKVVGPGTTFITASQASNATYGADRATRALKVLPASTGLLTHLKFNSNLNDVFGNNGSIFGTGSSYEAGKEQNALVLSGTQFVKLADGAVNHDNITIATFVKITENANWTRLFDFGTDKATTMFLTTNADNSNKIRFAIRKDNSAEQTITSISNSLLTLGQWVHVAVTLSSAGDAKLYVNGTLIPTEASVSPFTLKASDMGMTTQNMVGRSQWPDPYLKGAIDDFRIYNSVLSSSQILALSNNVLPVELDSYTAKANDNGQVTLNWKTLSETNNDYYIIERSINGTDFTKIGTISSKGSNGSYNFIDINPFAGQNYYQLSQVDKDGSRKELGIRSVMIGLKKQDPLLVYPNPVKGNVIAFQAPISLAGKQALVEVLNLGGQKMAELKVMLDDAAKGTLASGLGTGIYMLRIDKVYSSKIVVE